MRETFYKGAQGNLSLHVASVMLAGLGVGASVTLSEQLPIGTQITGVRVLNDALGADSEITIRLSDKDNSKTSLIEVDTVNSGSAVVPVKPVYIGDNGPSDLELLSSGAGAATGEVTVQVEYRFTGY